MKKWCICCILFLFPMLSQAQCAMCRATLENNVSHGEAGIATGLNFGILYLFVVPYLLVGVLFFFWYKMSRANAKQESVGHSERRLSSVEKVNT